MNGFPAALGKHTSLLPRWPGFITEYLKAPWCAPINLKKNAASSDTVPRKLLKTAQQPKAKQSGHRTNRKEYPNSHTRKIMIKSKVKAKTSMTKKVRCKNLIL